MPSPDRRRPVRLNAAPRRRPRPGPQAPKRPRAPRKAGGNSTAIYWIAVLVLVVLIFVLALLIELPRIKTFMADPRPHPAEQPKHDIVHPAAKPALPDDHPTRLQTEVEKETERMVERPVSPALPPPPKPAEPVVAQTPPPPKPVLPIVPPPPVPAKESAPVSSPAQETLPPVAQPSTGTNPGSPPSSPVRALPLDPNKLDTERIAAYQVALERIHFSCGFIDGDQGMRTQRMLRAFQASRGLSVTGFLDQPTRDAIGEPGEPFLNYTVTEEDIAAIMPKPATWREKSQAARLGYNDMWEMLAEKFHCTRGYLKLLNRDVRDFTPGTEVIGPKVFPAAPIPKAASLRILLSETSIEALDAGNKVVAFFPCSIAADKNKRPNGALTVKSIVPNPDYTFDPALFPDVSAREGITKKMVLPPGPRNPVGSAWVGLSLPGYGIHGTPEPENISRTQSHGCFRLANWNAEKVLRMVKVGTVVDVEP
jgi:lipoprotein-anchoring transpeptidase ErfK/SrfK